MCTGEKNVLISLLSLAVGASEIKDIGLLMCNFLSDPPPNIFRHIA